jgi:hypothetical protein
MAAYTGPLDDCDQLIRFFREEAAKLRSLRKLIVSPSGTVIRDVNGEGMEFPGLTYGAEGLEALLRELGVIFVPKVLHDPNATPNGIKEFRLSARWTWGHDRVM